jgi:hypothetical protein
MYTHCGNIGTHCTFFYLNGILHTIITPVCKTHTIIVCTFVQGFERCDAFNIRTFTYIVGFMFKGVNFKIISISHDCLGTIFWLPWHPKMYF